MSAANSPGGGGGKDERVSDAIIEDLLTSLQHARVQAETALVTSDNNNTSTSSHSTSTSNSDKNVTVQSIQFDALQVLLKRVDALEQRNAALESSMSMFTNLLEDQSTQRQVQNLQLGQLRRAMEKGGMTTLGRHLRNIPRVQPEATSSGDGADANAGIDIGERAKSLQGALGLNAGFKSGWLYKEGRVRKAPKRRWFVLRGDKLLYFGGPNSPTDKPKGTILLESCAVETTQHELKISSSYTATECLVLLTHDRKLYFVGETVEETLAWKIAIHTSITCCNYVRKSRIQNQPTDKRVMDFFNNPDATELKIIDTPVTMEALAALSQGLAVHLHLTTLRVRNVKLTGLEMGIIADGLSQNTHLKILDVSRNDLGPDGSKEIGRVLTGNDTIEELNVQHNNIGCQGVAHIAGTLGQHRSLQRLFLQYNKIKDDGAIALANALCSKGKYEGWHTMPSLELSYNEISCDGAAALSAIISVNPNVATVRLQNNLIGDSGAESIANALAANKSVQELELLCNPIGVKGSQALTGVLQSNSTLTALDVSTDLTLQSSGLTAVRALWRCGLIKLQLEE